MSTASQQKFYEVNGILVIVMDILIWAVPIPMLWRVRISLVSTKIPFPPLCHLLISILQRKKIAVLGVFSVGLLSIAGRLLITLSVPFLFISFSSLFFP